MQTWNLMRGRIFSYYNLASHIILSIIIPMNNLVNQNTSKHIFHIPSNYACLN